MFYKPKYFVIQELVDQETYIKFGERALGFFNPLLLISIDGVREFFNSPLTINNWHKGGDFQWRGLRTKECEVGASYGMHRFGGAIDTDIKGVTAEEARKAIIENKDDERLKYITCLEDDVNWLHLDVRNIPSRIKLIKP